MKDALRKLLAKECRDASNTSLTEEEAIDILGVIAHRAVGKQKAQEIMQMPKTTFDTYVRIDAIPKGRKRGGGFTELVWYEDELRQSKMKLNR